MVTDMNRSQKERIEMTRKATTNLATIFELTSRNTIFMPLEEIRD